MKILRYSVLALFIITLCAFVWFNIMQLRLDHTYPEIIIENDIIDVSLDADRSELLTGVTAYDEKDGDITDKIIIESISRFTEKGVSVVKYSVCDNDNHSSSAQRKIRYADYTSPHFTLSDSLVFGVSENISIRYILGAVDCIDGDISDKVIITAIEYSSQTAGTYNISEKVTNSKGDKITLRLPIYIEQISLSSPEIVLKDYLMYVKTGDSVDIDGNLLSATSYDGEDLRDAVVTDTNINTSVPGQYEVHYRCTDSAGRSCHKVLTVIVEE